jgi:hypothetical protein
VARFLAELTAVPSRICDTHACAIEVMTRALVSTIISESAHLADLKQHDEQLAPFARQLRQLAQSFEDQAALIQPYLEQT